MPSKFYNSKTNTFLLLILIILMVVAISIMSKDKEAYLPMFEDNTKVENNNQAEDFNNEVFGNKDDLISFSIEPGQKVSGKMTITGEIKGGYFFEGNILVSILDSNKNVLINGYGTATTDWMTASPVPFTASIDFTGLTQGKAYIEIQNDDPSGGEGGPAKKILIPVIIKDSGSFNLEVTDENFEEQQKWATEDNGLPKGWVRWNDTMAEIPVKKYGPSETGSSYIVQLSAKMINGLEGQKKCMGDSELAMCAIGTNPEVLRYFEIVNYRN